MAGIFINGYWSCGWEFTTTPTHILTAIDSAGGFVFINNASARFQSPIVGALTPQGIIFNPSGTSSYGHIVLGTNLQTSIHGFAYKVNTFSSVNNVEIYQWYDTTAGSPQITLVITPQGKLAFARGNYNGTVIATAVNSLQTNSWVYVECKVAIDPTAGLVECRVNGTVVISFIGNTRNTANSYVNSIYLGSQGDGSVQNTFDDWYMLDMTGAAPLNNYLGDTRINTFPPAADSATAGLNQFSTSPVQSAGSHYINVREAPPDDDTSYNFDATVGDRESYRFPGITTSASISAINVWARLRKDDASSRIVAIVARNGGVDSVGSNINSPSSYTYFNQVFVFDPATGSAWTPAGFGTGTLSNAEFGIKILQ